ncbi:hypothetical protein DFH09DRAFT_1337040 [Mycena vulgaris]|nr:hypothetical protein DFH09DRAFT_1337040 [Mycena vulgaris]
MSLVAPIHTVLIELFVAFSVSSLASSARAAHPAPAPLKAPHLGLSQLNTLRRPLDHSAVNMFFRPALPHPRALYEKYGPPELSGHSSSQFLRPSAPSDLLSSCAQYQPTPAGSRPRCRSHACPTLPPTPTIYMPKLCPAKFRFITSDLAPTLVFCCPYAVIMPSSAATSGSSILLLFCALIILRPNELSCQVAGTTLRDCYIISQSVDTPYIILDQSAYGNVLATLLQIVGRLVTSLEEGLSIDFHLLVPCSLTHSKYTSQMTKTLYPLRCAIKYSSPSAQLGYKEADVATKAVNLVQGENFAPSFLKLNPNGTVPTLKSDDGEIYTSTRQIVVCLVNDAPRKVAAGTAIIAAIHDQQYDPNVAVFLVRDDAELAAKSTGFPKTFIATRHPVLKKYAQSPEEAPYKAFYDEKIAFDTGILALYTDTALPAEKAAFFAQSAAHFAALKRAVLVSAIPAARHIAVSSSLDYDIRHIWRHRSPCTTGDGAHQLAAFSRASRHEGAAHRGPDDRRRGCAPTAPSTRSSTRTFLAHTSSLKRWYGLAREPARAVIRTYSSPPHSSFPVLPLRSIMHPHGMLIAVCGPRRTWAWWWCAYARSSLLCVGAPSLVTPLQIIRARVSRRASGMYAPAPPTRAHIVHVLRAAYRAGKLTAALSAFWRRIRRRTTAEGEGHGRTCSRNAR